jgi:SAM-dependent methyltransferase
MNGVALLTLVLIAQAQDLPAEGVPRLRREAEALAPLVSTKLARSFLGATKNLPRIAPRKLYRDKELPRYLTEADAGADREGLVPLPVDETFYYYTKYGSPLAYVRPLELLGNAGVNDVAGTRVLDFGCGGIGPLRLLANLGADAVGVDVDPLLPVLYSEAGDQGPVAGKGRVTLVNGRFPADQEVRAKVGASYDWIIAKNTLKRGYVHPERPVDQRFLIDLGVDDEGFLKALYESLKPGGRVLIYNLAPAMAPPDKPYVPMADGRCPFSAEQWEAAGFRVVMIDRDDSTEARAMGHALGWDQGERPMDLEKNLFASATLVQRPAKEAEIRPGR